MAMVIDDGISGRHEHRENLLEQIGRPDPDADPEAAAEYDRTVWAKKNVEAMQNQGVTMGSEDDPHLAKPVQRAPRTLPTGGAQPVPAQPPLASGAPIEYLVPDTDPTEP